MKYSNLKTKCVILLVCFFLIIKFNFADPSEDTDLSDNNQEIIKTNPYVDLLNDPPGSCTCILDGYGQYAYCDPGIDNCHIGFDQTCIPIIDNNNIVIDCGCSCIGPDPQCSNGQTQLCPNQNGVCSGSFETCTNQQWPGCNTNTYINWANSQNWLYQADTETTCDDDLDNDCDSNMDCDDEDCREDLSCLSGCIINYYYNDECDNVDERNSWGKLCKVEDCSSTTEFWYDDKGNIIEQNITIDGYSFIIEYEYDSNNNLIKEILPNNKDIEYFYNELNQVERVEYDNKDVSIYYTQEGLLDNLIYENDVDVNYNYNDKNIVDEINIDYASENLFNKEYEYDNVGNLRFLNENGNLLAEFIYDNLYRLITVDDDNYYEFDLLNFQYDKSGNRLNKNQDGSNIVYSYESSSNRLLSVNSGSLTNLEYDSSGNLVKVNDVKKYYYNIDNMLTSVDINNNGYIDEQYSYDYKNQRVKKAYGLSQGSYIYDDSGIIYYVYDFKDDLVYSLKNDLGNTPVIKTPIGGAVAEPELGDSG